MTKFVAGEYKQQQKYKSFTPFFVNRHFAWKNPQINVLMAEAMHLLGELNAYAELIPDVDFFIQMTIKKEARDSNLLEGTRTELDEVVLPQADVPPIRREDRREVRNYIEAMHFAIAKLSELPLCMRLVKEAHKILLSGVRGKHKAPGEIRRSQNWIGGSTLSDAFFVPASPEEVPDLLSDLEKFWHNPSLQLPPLIKIAITHYQFETIHPFLDGNGRAGRLLIVLQLIGAKILERPGLYISTFFQRHKDAYYDSLTRVRKLNNIEQWIVFFLNGIADAAKRTRETFKSITALRQEYDTEIFTLGARAENAQKLLRFMYSQPIVKVNWVVDELNINYPTANRLLKSLTELGILKEITGYSRNRLFVLEKYLNLFRN